LWEEEGANEVWIGRPERDVTLVDVHHVGLGVEAILLSSKIVCERQWCEVTRSAERDAHVCCIWIVTCGIIWRYSCSSSDMESPCCRDGQGNLKPTLLCLRLSYVYNVPVERRSRVVM